MKTVTAIGLSAALLLVPLAGFAQVQNPVGTAEQRQAMTDMAWMDGEWVGEAAITTPGGTMAHPHTERIGTMLGGSIRVIEGHSYNEDGSTGFNAFAILSWDDDKDAYVMRSYANGRVGDFPLTKTVDGFAWTTPFPGGEMQYVTIRSDEMWVETGTLVMSGRDPMKVIELRLRRRGDTGWPGANPVAQNP